MHAGGWGQCLGIPIGFPHICAPVAGRPEKLHYTGSVTHREWVRDLPRAVRVFRKVGGWARHGGARL